MNRLFITTSDIQILTGNSPQYARRILNRIRDQFGKQRHQHVTFDEFANYEGIETQQIINSLLLKRT